MTDSQAPVIAEGMALIAEAESRHQRVVYRDDPRYQSADTTAQHDGCSCGLLGWPCSSLEYRLTAQLRELHQRDRVLSRQLETRANGQDEHTKMLRAEVDRLTDALQDMTASRDYLANVYTREVVKNDLRS